MTRWPCPLIERALDLGVNYLDTSSIYGGPERWSEHYIGQVMKTRRSEAFLASKTKERTRDGFAAHVGEIPGTSADRPPRPLATARRRHDDDVEKIFAKGGAMEALLQARDQKMVRFLGVTGHHRPDALMEAIQRHPFDTILMALNAADKHHFSFMDELLPLAVEKQMGIIGMKVPARGRILSSWTPPPLEQQKHSVGRRGASQGTGHAPHARGDVLHAFPAGEHGHYRLRLHRATGGKRATGPRLHAVQRSADGGHSQKAEPVAKQALFFRFFRRIEAPN